MTLPLELVSPKSVGSCRTDYSSHTFKLHTPDAEDELFAYCNDLAERVLPVKGFEPVRKGKHFDLVWSHKSGVSLEITPTKSDKSSAGTALAVFSGGVWGALDASERRDLIIDMRHWPGYMRTTRWDPQITTLNPSVDVAEIARRVADGELWAAGFTQQNPWGPRNLDGTWSSSPTQYFGSPQSLVRLRIYDHGVKWGWETPSLRIEAQIRKRYADDHFRRLAERCYEQRSAPPLLVNAEERSVKDALSQHADFRDTSAWKGRPRPKKWRQTAPIPEWWTEILRHEGDPLSLTHKPAVDWDRATDVGLEQYGRKVACALIRDTCNEETPFDVQCAALGLRACQFLKREDLFALKQQTRPETHEHLEKLFRALTELGAIYGEEMPTKNA